MVVGAFFGSGPSGSAISRVLIISTARGGFLFAGRIGWVQGRAPGFGGIVDFRLDESSVGVQLYVFSFSGVGGICGRWQILVGFYLADFPWLLVG